MLPGSEAAAQLPIGWDKRKVLCFVLSTGSIDLEAKWLHEFCVCVALITLNLSTIKVFLLCCG